MDAKEVMKALEKLANPQARKTYARHGCPEPFFGVKLGDLKGLVKRIRTDTPLARELYKTRNSDAMYLAGLIADGNQLTRKELDEWAKSATWHMISGCTVPWVASENPQGWEAALKWIDSPIEKISVAGWTTLTAIVSVRGDADLDLKAIERLLDRVARTIHAAPNRTRYAMNGFVIGVGSYVKPLTARALQAAAKIGPVEVDMGDTACTVPLAADYIKKVIARGNHGKKRKTAKC